MLGEHWPPSKPVLSFRRDMAKQLWGVAAQPGSQQIHVSIRRVGDVPMSCDLSPQLVTPSRGSPKGLLFVLNKAKGTVGGCTRPLVSLARAQSS